MYCILGSRFLGETLQMLAYLGEETPEGLLYEKKREKFRCSAMNREDPVRTRWLSGMAWVGSVG